MENQNKYNDDELKKAAPTLFGMEKKTPDVPKDYFENLPNTIMERIQNKTEKKTWWNTDSGSRQHMTTDRSDTMNLKTGQIK